MTIFGPVERLHASLDYHLARHNVLASNLAHVDTPNYHPLDLAPSQAFKGAMKAALARTDEQHISGSKDAAAGHIIRDASAAAGRDGNGVSLDREAVKIAANNMRYDAIATLTSDELSGLAWAANDGRMG